MNPHRKWLIRCETFLQQITPDPFILALALSVFTMVVATAVTPKSPSEVILAWSQGFWSLTTFTLQMLMILVAGFILASAPAVRRTLTWVAAQSRSESSAIFILTVVSMSAYILNWALGLIVGAFLALEMAKRHPNLNLRVLVAASYTGFVVWHGGLSGSIPLLLNTPGNFSEAWLGGVVPLSKTLFSPVNIACVVASFLFLPILNLGAARVLGRAEMQEQKNWSVRNTEFDAADVDLSVKTWADEVELSPLVVKGVGLFLIGALLLQAITGPWSLDLNRMISLLLGFGFLLHPHLRSYSRAAQLAIGKGSGILLQYPFYGGIMGVMTNTNLTQWVSDAFLSIATRETFGVLTLWSAAFVNFLVPSGGGQWAVQGPIALEAARALNVDSGFTAMAIAWGGTLTDLAQPFWALPVLAIVGLKARDIIGPCLLTLVSMTALISVIFFVLQSA